MMNVGLKKNLPEEIAFLLWLLVNSQRGNWDKG